jgi:aspartyl-tRNA(Asn)/glutamyl-tRNA(Gln) amidotransferase subunit C
MTMALTRQQVKHVAELAKLSLTGAEIDLFQEQLSAVLEFAARLDELETKAIPPTATVLPLRNVMRLDKARPSVPRDVMLKNAPAVAEGCIKVKAVLEGTD